MNGDVLIEIYNPMTIKEDVDKEIKADEIINTKKRYENKKLVHVNGSCVRVDFQKQIKPTIIS